MGIFGDDKRDEWNKVDEYGNPVKEKSTTDKIVRSLKDLGSDLVGTNERKVQKQQQIMATTTNNEYLNKLSLDDRVQAMAESPEYKYDYQLALKNNIPAKDILDHLDSKGTIYNIAKAREAGLDDATIIKHLDKKSRSLQQAKVQVKLGFFSTSNIAKGVIRSASRLDALAVDGLEAVGAIDSETNKKAIKGLHQMVSSMEAGMEDKDSLGAMVGEMLSMPIGIQSKMGLYGLALLAGAQGASYGYGTSRLEGNNKDEAISEGIVGGVAGATLGTALAQTGRLIGYGGEVILGKISQKAKERAINVLQKEYNLTPQQVQRDTAEYLRLSESAGGRNTGMTAQEVAQKLEANHQFKGDEDFMNPQNQLLAVMSKYLPREGTPHVRKMLDSSPELLTALKGARVDRINKFLHETKQDSMDIAETIKAIADKNRATMKAYSDFITKIGMDNTYRKVHKFSLAEKELADFTDPNSKTIYDNLKKTLNNDMTLGDLLHNYKAINQNLKTLGKDRGTTKGELKAIKKDLDSTIAQAMDASHYAEWRLVNENYAKMAEFTRETNLGKKLSEADGGAKTSSSLIESLFRGDDGIHTFDSMREYLGHEMTAKVEKGLIAEFIARDRDVAGFSELKYTLLEKNMAKKGFVTEEGKRYIELIKHLKDTYAIDDFVRNVKHRDPSSKDLGNRSSDVTNKVLSGLLTWMVDNASKTLAGINPAIAPKSLINRGNRALSYETLERVVSKGIGLNDFKKAISEFPPSVVEEKLSRMYDTAKSNKANKVEILTQDHTAHYTYPYLSNDTLRQHSFVAVVKKIKNIGNDDIDKLMGMTGLDKLGINSTEALAHHLSRLGLDIIKYGKISPRDLAKAIQEEGSKLINDGIQKSIHTLQEPLRMVHYSHHKFDPSQLREGTKVKNLGKGTYFSDTLDKDNIAYKYDFTLPINSKILEMPDKATYDTILQNLGFRTKEQFNALLKEQGVQVIVVKHNNKRTINVLDADLLKSIKKGYREHTPSRGSEHLIEGGL